MSASPFLDVLEEIVTQVVEPAAADVDATGTFPRAAVTALGQAGLLGLISSTDVGGMGLGMAEASQVVRRLASACGSTAMVVCMHYCATAVIEAQGPDDVRRAIAAGEPPLDAGLLGVGLPQPLLGAAVDRDARR